MSSFVTREAGYAGYGACFILVEPEFGEQWEFVSFSESLEEVTWTDYFPNSNGSQKAWQKSQSTRIPENFALACYLVELVVFAEKSWYFAYSKHGQDALLFY